MTKLKLGPITETKPVKVTVELPADLPLRQSRKRTITAEGDPS